MIDVSIVAGDQTPEYPSIDVAGNVATVPSQTPTILLNVDGLFGEITKD